MLDTKLVVLLLAYKHILIFPMILNVAAFFPATTIFQVHQAMPLLSVGFSPTKLMHTMDEMRLLQRIEEDEGPVGTLFRSYYRLDTVTTGKYRLLMDASAKC
jgi:hypothetical protein